MATTRSLERAMAAVGLIDQAVPVFAHHQGIANGGVLFALPALTSQGLLLYKQVYDNLSNGYYGLQSTILTLAFMALCRIKNPEQLKQHNAGELGALIGLDRVPEVRCLREKIKQVVAQNKAQQYNGILLNHWLKNEDEFFFYIDGHVRIYYGHGASLPLKYVSRQKLCLSATTEYWVNDMEGLPYLVFMGELNEKMQEVIEHRIVPQLKINTCIAKRISTNEKVLFTLVFDRECYEPAFFQRLWTDHQIAVITYRKNVTGKWGEALFKPYKTTVIGNSVTVLLCEQQTTLGSHPFREIRSLTESGHQTAIITTNPDITIDQVASKMFSRWSQENYFKYLIADYNFDKMIQYGIETIDETRKIINPEYRKITHRIKKLTEKIQRQEAKFYKVIDQVHTQPIDHIITLSRKQLKATVAIETLKSDKEILQKQRADMPHKITLKDMPDATRYNKLKTESKLFMNIIKMICYRAETAMAELISPYFYKQNNEKRMLIKQLFNTPADIMVNEQNQTLTITIASLSATRYNDAIKELCTTLNQTETVFPGTNLKLIYKNNAN